eukprot:1175915-Prorocentrum_minimum.AAC.1
MNEGLTSVGQVGGKEAERVHKAVLAERRRKEMAENATTRRARELRERKEAAARRNNYGEKTKIEVHKRMSMDGNDGNDATAPHHKSRLEGGKRDQDSERRGSEKGSPRGFGDEPPKEEEEEEEEETPYVYEPYVFKPLVFQSFSSWMDSGGDPAVSAEEEAGAEPEEEVGAEPEKEEEEEEERGANAGLRDDEPAGAEEPNDGGGGRDEEEEEAEEEVDYDAMPPAGREDAGEDEEETAEPSRAETEPQVGDGGGGGGGGDVSRAGRSDADLGGGARRRERTERTNANRAKRTDGGARNRIGAVETGRRSRSRGEGGPRGWQAPSVRLRFASRRLRHAASRARSLADASPRVCYIARVYRARRRNRRGGAFRGSRRNSATAYRPRRLGDVRSFPAGRHWVGGCDGGARVGVRGRQVRRARGRRVRVARKQHLGAADGALGERVARERHSPPVPHGADAGSHTDASVRASKS